MRNKSSFCTIIISAYACCFELACSRLPLGGGSSHARHDHEESLSELSESLDPSQSLDQSGDALAVEQSHTSVVSGSGHYSEEGYDDEVDPDADADEQSYQMSQSEDQFEQSDSMAGKSPPMRSGALIGGLKPPGGLRPIGTSNSLISILIQLMFIYLLLWVSSHRDAHFLC